MAKKNYLIGAGILAVAAGLAIGLADGFQASKANPASAAEQTVPGPLTSEKIESLKANLDKVAQYEMAYGCTTADKFGRKEFCGESKQKVDALHDQLAAEVRKLQERDPAAVAAVVSNIREFTGDSNLSVEFNSSAANPYTTGNQVRIEQYRDSKGFIYLINPAANKVIQMGPGPDSKIQFADTPRLSTGELRSKAEAFLEQKIEGFDQIKANYSSREMSKPGNMSYAFRWEAKSVPQGEELAPFVQVVLSPAGDVMSFNDTTSLYSQN
jgi:hypothetical protein